MNALAAYLRVDRGTPMAQGFWEWLETKRKELEQ